MKFVNQYFVSIYIFHSFVKQMIHSLLLGYVKYAHPNEAFVRGKINEAISGPFRTAKFKAMHPSNRCIIIPVE